LVSIPTGSITVNLAPQGKGWVRALQFQLVRLQLAPKVWKKYRHLVSIPTGSITVSQPTDQPLPVDWFQFQLVRLQL